MVPSDAPPYLWIFTNAVAVLSACGWLVNWFRGRPRARIQVHPDWDGQEEPSASVVTMYRLPISITNTGSGEARDVCIYMADGGMRASFRQPDGSEGPRTHWVGALLSSADVPLDALTMNGVVQLMISWRDGPGHGTSHRQGYVLFPAERRIILKKVPRSARIVSASHPHGTLQDNVALWPADVGERGLWGRLRTAVRIGRLAYKGEIES